VSPSEIYIGEFSLRKRMSRYFVVLAHCPRCQHFSEESYHEAHPPFVTCRQFPRVDGVSVDCNTTLTKLKEVSEIGGTKEISLLVTQFLNEAERMNREAKPFDQEHFLAYEA